MKRLADDNILSDLDITLSWQKRAQFLRKLKHSLLVRQKSCGHFTLIPCVMSAWSGERLRPGGGRPRPRTALSHLWTLDMGSRGAALAFSA